MGKFTSSRNQSIDPLKDIDSSKFDVNDEQLQTGSGVYIPMAAKGGRTVSNQKAQYMYDNNLDEMDPVGGTAPQTGQASANDGEMRERLTGENDDMEHPVELNSAEIINRAEELARTS